MLFKILLILAAARDINQPAKASVANGPVRADWAYRPKD